MDQLELTSLFGPSKSLDLEVTVDRIQLADGARRKLSLSNGSTLTLHRYCCVGLNDVLRLSRRSSGVRIEADCKNGTAVVLPAFAITRSVDGLGIRLKIREAMDQGDLKGYEALAGYHYRSHGSFGRRSILVASLEGDGRSLIVGYIEITNTFSGHQRRNKLLDSAFRDGSGVAWEKWDIEARRNYLNAIARISRCVVHPEYRGVGIGVELCRAAIDYCRTHWHIARLRPLFLEITADMLKFVPFAESAGMKFIGTTSGNLERVKKDHSYLGRVAKDIREGVRTEESHAVFSVNAKSILKKQRADVERMVQIAQDHGVEVDQFLATFLSSSTPEGMSPTAYDLLTTLLRFPKPTYMCGLTSDASAFLNRRLTELPSEDRRSAEDGVRPVVSPPRITLRGVSVRHEFDTPLSGWSNAIREAFGIDRRLATTTGICDLSLSIEPGAIVYVWGPSGSGKTGLLELLSGKRGPSTGTICGLEEKEKRAIFDLTFEDLPLVEIIGTSQLETALYCLNLAGLSEAALYLKRPHMLSTGQRHRLGIAKLISSRKPVWIVDEFCSVLDDVTGAIVARSLGRVARSLGVTAVIAGPRQDPVISSLAPDYLLNLSTLQTWELVDCAAVSKRARRVQ